MNYIGRVINNCKYIYNEINAATLTGAIDVIVVEQPDGSYTCSPFHVRFGKLGVLRSKEKVVDIEINGEPVDIHMKLGESGEAFFVEEVADAEEISFIPPHLACSPIPPDSEEWPHLDDDDEAPLDQNSKAPDLLDSLAAPQMSPRTFKAETVADTSENNPRMLSANDFRPITGDDGSASSKESVADFVKDDSPSNDEANSVTVSKRKRRKKSLKKKNALKRNSVGSGIEPIQEKERISNEPIFQIEDLELNGIEKDVAIPGKHIKEDVPEVPCVQDIPVERGGDIHFFSDTEITPGTSPREEYAPVQSDSEFETKRFTVVGEGSQGGAAEEQPKSWKWGELPTPEPEDKKNQESHKWLVYSMLDFMKKTKHMRHKNDNEGVYLSEINDSEMAALYLNNHYAHSQAPNFDHREEDAESGNGPSLPQSPHSVEGAICGPKSEENKSQWYPDEVALSLCGLEAPEQFSEFQIRFSDFASNPAVLSNPKLVIKLDGQIYSWKVAAPIVTSLFFFHKPLPQDVIQRLISESGEKQKTEPQRKAQYSSWFNWSKHDGPNGSGVDSKGADKKTPDESDLKAENPSEQGPVEPQTIEPPKPIIRNSISDKGRGQNATEKFRKTLRLTSDQISKLKLQSGANELEFSVTTAYQGTSRCKCFLFCWRYDDKIVVSDIDGTITRSDVLGHILPIVGKDWAQSGVAKLFTKIKENGYKLLYLSARAIGQSRLTREYLKSIKQEDLTLPEGPMLLNPTSLLNAFHTEVIEKKPEEFKISCLRDIQALFPPHIKPFYAGYGNKINDVWAYQSVGIPIFRIFTINYRGELKHELTETFQSTYQSMTGLVDQMFPSSKPLSSEDFTQYIYWRDPIPEIESLPEL